MCHDYLQNSSRSVLAFYYCYARVLHDSKLVTDYLLQVMFQNLHDNYRVHLLPLLDKNMIHIHHRNESLHRHCNYLHVHMNEMRRKDRCTMWNTGCKYHGYLQSSSRSVLAFYYCYARVSHDSKLVTDYLLQVVSQNLHDNYQALLPALNDMNTTRILHRSESLHIHYRCLHVNMNEMPHSDQCSWLSIEYRCHGYLQNSSRPVRVFYHDCAMVEQ